jgi:hypothetical protein
MGSTDKTTATTSTATAASTITTSTIIIGATAVGRHERKRAVGSSAHVVDTGPEARESAQGLQEEAEAEAEGVRKDGTEAVRP